MTTTQQTDTAATIDKARQYVRQIADQVRDVYAAPAPRFTIEFDGLPGAGSGGCAGVTADGADRYLRELARDRPVSRYGLLRIEVRVEIPTLSIAA